MSKEEMNVRVDQLQDNDNLVKLETKAAAADFSKQLGIMPEEEAKREILASPVPHDKGKTQNMEETVSELNFKI